MTVSPGLRTGWAEIWNPLSPPGKQWNVLGSVFKLAEYFQHYKGCILAVQKRPWATVKWPPAELLHCLGKHEVIRDQSTQLMHFL